MIKKAQMGDDNTKRIPRPCAEGLGAKGILVEKASDLLQALRDAKAFARAGSPVLVNLHLGKSEFRKGAISM